MPTDDPRAFLRALFDRAVEIADPMRSLAAHLPERPPGRVIVVGAGKASARMAEAVEAAWGPCRGLVITRYGYGRPLQGIELAEAAHPVPDQAGLRATGRMLDLAGGLGEGDFVLALISGGASSLLVAPAPGLTLADKQAVNAALLASGVPIDRMNTVRKHLSAVKGGQLAASAWPARMLSLILSDVPGDDPAFIGSGPTIGDTSSAADALAIIDGAGIAVPDAVRQSLHRGSGVVGPGDPRLALVENRIFAAPAQSLSAAAGMAAQAGCDVRMLGDAVEGEAREVGAAHGTLALTIAQTMKPGDAPVLVLSGGELTVTRRGDGSGGPNAEYALALAIALDGAPGIHAIACDTDGVDGAAEIAGAIVGPHTLARARAMGVDAGRALAANDSHGFFTALGDSVVTGPTLTNVNDFRAILILPP